MWRQLVDQNQQQQDVEIKLEFDPKVKGISYSFKEGVHCYATCLPFDNQASPFNVKHSASPSLAKNSQLFLSHLFNLQSTPNDDVAARLSRLSKLNADAAQAIPSADDDDDKMTSFFQGLLNKSNT